MSTVCIQIREELIFTHAQHARIQKVLPAGVHFFDKGKEDPNSTKSEPSSVSAKRHLNGVSLANDDGPTLNAGLTAL